MPKTYRYLLNGLGVYKKSPQGRQLIGPGENLPDEAIWGQLTDPAEPDGDQLVEEFPDGTVGDRFEQGFQKIAEPGTNTIRNATPAQLVIIIQAEADRQNKIYADAAAEIRTNPVTRKLLMGILRLVRQDVNQLRRRVNDLATKSNEYGRALRNDNLKLLLPTNRQTALDDVHTAIGNVGTNLEGDEPFSDVRDAFLALLDPDD